jgi:hypothetical protein
MDKFLAFVVLITGAIMVAMLISLLLAIPVMFLWNWIAVDLFHAPVIGWIQAWGLNLLAGFLFRTTVNNNNNNK